LIQPDDPQTACPACTQEYHESCWTELGGCGTYGCDQVPAATKPAVSTRPGQGWGDVKPCPSCGVDIASSMLRCKCGARFPYADPISPAEFEAWVGEQRAVRRAKRLITVLFIITLIGLIAPLTGTIAGVYAYARRERLAGANGTFLAIGFGSAAIGAIHAIVMLLLAVGL
jgi:hypothetical protein